VFPLGKQTNQGPLFFFQVLFFFPLLPWGHSLLPGSRVLGGKPLLLPVFTPYTGFIFFLGLYPPLGNKGFSGALCSPDWVFFLFIFFPPGLKKRFWALPGERSSRCVELAQLFPPFLKGGYFFPLLRAVCLKGFKRIFPGRGLFKSPLL